MDVHATSRNLSGKVIAINMMTEIHTLPNDEYIVVPFF